MYGRLAPADYVTLAGLGLAWAAVCLLVLGRPDAATLALLPAFCCDKADGVLARRGHGSALGPPLDALADVVIYLVPAAVLLPVTLDASPALAVLAGGAVLGFGVLRLARFRVDDSATGPDTARGDGERTDGGATVYHGLTAFHVAAWALLVRLGVALTALPATAGAVAVGAGAPLMVAPIRVRVTRWRLAGAVAVGVVLAAGALSRLVGLP